MGVCGACLPHLFGCEEFWVNSLKETWVSKDDVVLQVSAGRSATRSCEFPIGTVTGKGGNLARTEGLGPAPGGKTTKGALPGASYRRLAPSPCC